MDIATALGLFVAERQEGAFKDMVMTFSQTPELVTPHGGNITARLKNLRRANWNMNTDIMQAMRLILGVAQRYEVPVEDMPKALLILSDMEFDANWLGSNHFMTDVKEMFAGTGYEVPKIVFWNLDTRNSNIPVQRHESGTALISGYSPSVLNSLIENGLEDVTPERVMEQTIMKSRYNWQNREV